MPLSAEEQYLLELINQGRLDPTAEAKRYGIDLNASLAEGTISTAAKQVLAPNALLETAAIGHSQSMLAADIFSHVGADGSTLGSRATAVKYPWNTLGENIAVWGTSGTVDLTAAIENHHRGLFLSAGHRTNLMNGTLSEVGLAQETGLFTFSPGREFNSSMLTQMFGHTQGNKFLTGVAYSDANANNFYSVGEGKASTQFTVAGSTATTEAAGGYALKVAATGEALVSGRAGSQDFTVTVDFSGGNVKLDVINGSKFKTSADVKLGTGIAKVELLGSADLDATGNSNANLLLGNTGANTLKGGRGKDWIEGRAGDDTISGGRGADRLQGDGGADELKGGRGTDSFVFANGSGADDILDFRKGQGEQLVLHDDLWTGTLRADQVVSSFASTTANGVVFNFGDGDTLTLEGVTSTAGLAALIEIV